MPRAITFRGWTRCCKRPDEASQRWRRLRSTSRTAAPVSMTWASCQGCGETPRSVARNFDVNGCLETSHRSKSPEYSTVKSIPPTKATWLSTTEHFWCSPCARCSTERQFLSSRHCTPWPARISACSVGSLPRWPRFHGSSGSQSKTRTSTPRRTASPRTSTSESPSAGQSAMASRSNPAARRWSSSIYCSSEPSRPAR